MIGLVLRGDHCQCGGCGLYFNSTLAFDKHRTGRRGIDRGCRSATEMIQIGMVLKPNGFWISAADSRRGAKSSLAVLASGGDLPA